MDTPWINQANRLKKQTEPHRDIYTEHANITVCKIHVCVILLLHPTATAPLLLSRENEEQVSLNHTRFDPPETRYRLHLFPTPSGSVEEANPHGPKSLNSPRLLRLPRRRTRTFTFTCHLITAGQSTDNRRLTPFVAPGPPTLPPQG